jgi:hypothetical protein
MRPMPSIHNHGGKRNDQNGKNARGDLQPRLTRLRAAIRFDRDYRNYGLQGSFQLTDESISTPRQRLDKARTLGRVAEDFPELVDGSVEVALDIYKRVRPETLLQLFPGHHVSGAFQQDREDLEWLPAELQFHAILA